MQNCLISIQSFDDESTSDADNRFTLAPPAPRPDHYAQAEEDAQLWGFDAREGSTLTYSPISQRPPVSY